MHKLGEAHTPCTLSMRTRVFFEGSKNSNATSAFHWRIIGCRSSRNAPSALSSRWEPERKSFVNYTASSTILHTYKTYTRTLSELISYLHSYNPNFLFVASAIFILVHQTLIIPIYLFKPGIWFLFETHSLYYWFKRSSGKMIDWHVCWIYFTF